MSLSHPSCWVVLCTVPEASHSHPYFQPVCSHGNVGRHLQITTERWRSQGWGDWIALFSLCPGCAHAPLRAHVQMPCGAKRCGHRKCRGAEPSLWLQLLRSALRFSQQRHLCPGPSASSPRWPCVAPCCSNRPVFLHWAPSGRAHCPSPGSKALGFNHFLC